MNANATLIAGVATLVLAIGVGFLIGRSGHDNSTAGRRAADHQGRRRRRRSGDAEHARRAKSDQAPRRGKAKKAKAPRSAIDSSGTSEAAEEVLKPPAT